MDSEFEVSALDPAHCVQQVDWRAVYERYAEKITRYLAKVTGDVETAKDLMQESFVRGIERQSQLRDRARLRPWLYRIATNLAISHLRRRRLRSRFGLWAAKRTDVALQVAEIDEVRTALRSIAPAQAACLILRERGFSRRDIAEICGVSEEAVKSRLARGEANFIAAIRRLGRGLSR